MTPRDPDPGTVVRFDLPDGHVAFGRVLHEGAVAVYRGVYDRSAEPPIGSRALVFAVGIYRADLRALPVVGWDPRPDDECWLPPMAVRPILPGDRWQVYERGALRPSSIDEAGSLEPAAVWHTNHIVDRILEHR